jgi:hypothetical protein
MRSVGPLREAILLPFLSTFSCTLAFFASALYFTLNVPLRLLLSSLVCPCPYACLPCSLHICESRLLACSPYRLCLWDASFTHPAACRGQAIKPNEWCEERHRAEGACDRSDAQGYVLHQPRTWTHSQNCCKAKGGPTNACSGARQAKFRSLLQHYMPRPLMRSVRHLESRN